MNRNRRPANDENQRIGSFIKAWLAYIGVMGKKDFYDSNEEAATYFIDQKRSVPGNSIKWDDVVNRRSMPTTGGEEDSGAAISNQPAMAMAGMRSGAISDTRGLLAWIGGWDDSSIRLIFSGNSLSLKITGDLSKPGEAEITIGDIVVNVSLGDDGEGEQDCSLPDYETIPSIIETTDSVFISIHGQKDILLLRAP